MNLIQKLIFKCSICGLIGYMCPCDSSICEDCGKNIRHCIEKGEGCASLSFKEEAQ
jgi:hypothetical protein